MNNLIKIKALKLKNFKGIKDLQIDLGKVTNIYGGNGTGKTTIFDSFMWLLFGKDSKDRKDYEIKTLDSNNNVLHGLEHSVTGTLEVDGETVTLQRLYKEKWTKKKGFSKKVFTGHETEYYIDEVPAKQKEYIEKIDNILADNTFKLISNPSYFNTLHWTKQREILFEIIGDVNSESVINHKDSLKPLGSLLIDKDVDEYRKQIKAKISKYNKDKESIPHRIDECNNSIMNEDFGALEVEKQLVLSEINSIEEQIADSSKTNEVKLKLQDKLYKLKSELQEGLTNAKVNQEAPLLGIRKQVNEVRSKIQDVDYEIKSLETKKTHSESLIYNCNVSIDKYKYEQGELREKWTKENEKSFEFNTSNTICPTCKKEYDQTYIDEVKTSAEQHFNSSKKDILSKISSEGKKYAAAIKDLENNIDKEVEEVSFIKSALSSLSAKRDEYERELEEIKQQEINFKPTENLFEGKEKLEIEISEIEGRILNHTIDNPVLKSTKMVLNKSLDEINKKLAKRENNETLKNRIQDLQEDERRISEEIADLEGQDFLCEDFIRTKVELLEGNINTKFKTVRFKLFNELNNGGLEDCCEALIDGVPFSAANTASQINAGLEIINTLSEHYEVVAPIFLDNRESVNEIVKVDGQVINLIVSTDKNLRIEGVETID